MCVTRTFFIFNDMARTEIYTLSLHDALPILRVESKTVFTFTNQIWSATAAVRYQHRQAGRHGFVDHQPPRSEEHTSELQSHSDLVCRLLLEKKKMQNILQGAATNKTSSPTLR